MSGNNKLYTHQRFVFMTLDPVHIGTGGYRLGRVDNTIVREPGTNLPKIPGTSLAGAVRSYAAMRYGKPEATGRHLKQSNEQKKDCPIVYTFGTATETGGGQRGKISIGDAQILFFPVHSIAGPVWVSTKEILEEAGFQSKNADNVNDETAFTSLTEERDNLNLGWLLLKIKNGLNVIPPDKNIISKKEWKAISSGIVLVSRKLFPQIVNSNLEVRTSVAIKPETGAAEERALFAYEAMPRATWLWCDIIQDDYLGNLGGFPKTDKQFKGGEENVGEPLGETWEKPLDVVKSGLELIEYLGIGGMGTRGFGKMKQICDWEVDKNES
jgi:CRISPR-associated protein Cmr4